MTSDNLPSCAAILVAAGSSTRMSDGDPKQFRLVAGRPLFHYSLDVLAAGFDPLVLVVAADRVDELLGNAAMGWGQSDRLRIVAGGQSRAESVTAGIQDLRSEETEYVAVHDAARPGLTRKLCTALRKGALDTGAAIPGLPLTDSIKRVESGQIVETVSRVGLAAVGTPQIFVLERFRRLLLAAELSAVATDCAQLWEAAGGKVTLIEGDPRAFKVTLEDDLFRFAALLKQSNFA